MCILSRRQPKFITRFLVRIKKRVFPENNCRRFHFDVIAQSTIAKFFFLHRMTSHIQLYTITFTQIRKIHALMEDETANK